MLRRSASLIGACCVTAAFVVSACGGSAKTGAKTVPRAAAPPTAMSSTTASSASAFKRGSSPPRVGNLDVNCAAAVPPGLPPLVPGDSSAERIYADGANAVLALGSSLPVAVASEVRAAARKYQSAADVSQSNPSVIRSVADAAGALTVASADAADAHLPKCAKALTRLKGSAAGRVRATFVGDSVAESIQLTPAARLALIRGLHMTLDLHVCRRLVAPSCPYQGTAPPTALSAVRSYGRALGTVLVLDVGYNDDSAGYATGIDDVMRAALAQGAQRVIWLTLRQTGGYTATYQRTNAVIRHAARRWSELRVADWNSYSAARPWFAGDQLHLNARGAEALAKFVRFYLNDVRPAP